MDTCLSCQYAPAAAFLQGPRGRRYNPGIKSGHIEEFVEKVEINTPGELIYKSLFKTAVSGKGRVFLEVRMNIQGKIKNLKGEAAQIIEETGVAGKVNREKVEAISRGTSEIVEVITP